MYRIAGIPARFVEGYKMNDALLKDGVYNVTNDTAHAWVEYLVTDDLWAISDCAPTAFEENLQPVVEEPKEETPKPDPDPQTNKPENTPNTSNNNSKMSPKAIPLS